MHICIMLNFLLYQYFWGQVWSHTSVPSTQCGYKERCLLECDAVLPGRYISLFQGNLLPVHVYQNWLSSLLPPWECHISLKLSALAFIYFKCTLLLIKLINPYLSSVMCGWWIFNLTIYCDMLAPLYESLEPSYATVDATSQANVCISIVMVCT